MEIGSLLREISPQVRTAEPMAGHTTFRIGGPADYFVLPENTEQLKRILEVCTGTQTPYFILGKGSNLLVRDEGFRGVVISMEGFSRIRVEGETLICGAGASLITAALTASNQGLSGLEFAGGIPGSVGGAVAMNAGAYGGEMAQVVRSVKILDSRGEEKVLSNAMLQFGYRISSIQTGQSIVLEAVLDLHRGDPEESLERIRQLNEQRKSKQPLEYPSAGSTFRRPEGHFAGKLIMDAGLRGLRVGDAQVSEKHCGFIINRGHATAQEVRRLIAQIQEAVYEQTGVRLETEIRLL